MPKIDVYAIAWNEERMINQFIDWYSYANSITILDNYSTDRTAEIARERGCNVVSFGSSEMDDKIQNDAREICWKNSTADWVIVCDMDEFLYHENILELLDTTQATIVRSVAYQMLSIEEDLCVNVKEGTRDTLYDKCILFRPDKITQMNWGPGCHNCDPTGDRVYLNNTIKLLHFSLIGKDRIKKRYAEYEKRLSDNQKAHGWGNHYQITTEESNKRFDDYYGKREKVW